MQIIRRRRQEGLIREALYIFLAVAIVMAVLLDGLAIFTAQQGARETATEAGREARATYVDTLSLEEARADAADLAASKDAELVAFTVTAATGTTPRTFTVTVRKSTDTYLFKYLRYLPGMDDWVHDVQNPVITRTTE